MMFINKERLFLDFLGFLDYSAVVAAAASRLTFSSSNFLIMKSVSSFLNSGVIGWAISLNSPFGILLDGIATNRTSNIVKA